MSYWKKLPHDCEPLQGVTVSGRYIKGWGRNTPFPMGQKHSISDGAETLHFGQEQSLGVGTGRVIGPVSLNKLVCAS